MRGLVPIRFSTYNIRNGRNRGLKSVLTGMAQANMDLGTFQETKDTDGSYTRGSAGYSVAATDMPSRQCSGMAVFHQLAPRFGVESVHKFGPNVVIFQLATGERRLYILVCHLSPNDTSTIESVVAALKERPIGAKLLVVGDFHANLAESEGDRRGGILRRPWRRRD